VTGVDKSVCRCIYPYVIGGNGCFRGPKDRVEHQLPMIVVGPTLVKMAAGEAKATGRRRAVLPPMPRAGGPSLRTSGLPERIPSGRLMVEKAAGDRHFPTPSGTRFPQAVGRL